MSVEAQVHRSVGMQGWMLAPGMRVGMADMGVRMIHSYQHETNTSESSTLQYN